MFYTKNKAIKQTFSKVKPPKRNDGWTSTLDIVPTLMDVLMAGSRNQPASSRLGFEGQSILDAAVTDRVVISIANPYNWHCIVVRQRHYKFAFYDRSSEYVMFDLARDPDEMNEIRKPSGTEEYDKWIDFAMEQVHTFLNRMAVIMPLKEPEPETIEPADEQPQ
jgi:arylsulfatase A-like enzyme